MVFREHALRSIKSGIWAGRVGILLLFLGLVFLFEFGVDQGWFTPVVRVLFGGVLGLVLLGLGLTLVRRRVALAHVLLGGSIATFFTTTYAAYHFYGLVVYGVAFGLMVLAALLCFGLAVRLHGIVLAFVATVGGLGTLFLLYTDEGSVPALVLYTCLVLACAGGIYLYRGWRSLVWAAALGGWVVLFIPWSDKAWNAGSFVADQAAINAGLIFSLLVFGVLPVLREWWQRQNPEQWGVPPARIKAWIVSRPSLVLTVLAPVLAFWMSVPLWDLSDTVWGTIGIAASAGYVAMYVVFSP